MNHCLFVQTKSGCKNRDALICWSKRPRSSPSPKSPDRAPLFLQRIMTLAWRESDCTLIIFGLRLFGTTVSSRISNRESETCDASANRQSEEPSICRLTRNNSSPMPIFGCQICGSEISQCERRGHARYVCLCILKRTRSFDV